MYSFSFKGHDAASKLEHLLQSALAVPQAALQTLPRLRVDLADLADLAEVNYEMVGRLGQDQHLMCEV